MTLKDFIKWLEGVEIGVTNDKGVVLTLTEECQEMKKALIKRLKKIDSGLVEISSELSDDAEFITYLIEGE